MTPCDEGGSRPPERWDAIAKRIVSEIKPRRALDFGCDGGRLVCALRDRGVEAFGIDLADGARGEMLEDAVPHCWRASAAEPIAGRYDLIVCVEALGHLGEDEARRAIANICASAGDVLFSATADDSGNVSTESPFPGSWWIERFAEHGMGLDVEFDAAFAAPRAMRFRIGAGPGGVIDALLAHRARLLREIDDRQEESTRREARLLDDVSATHHDVQSARSEVRERDQRLAELAVQRAAADAELAVLRQAARDKDQFIAGLNHHMLAMQRTIGWKVLERGRRLRDRVFHPGSRRWIAYWAVRRAVEVTLDEGIHALFFKARHKARLMWRQRHPLVRPPSTELTADALDARYQIWLERSRPGSRDVARMRAVVSTLAYAPVVSVLVPVTRTDGAFLDRCIESVTSQLYPYWELCVVSDGSAGPGVHSRLEEYGRGDPRITVDHLSQHAGAAGTSARAASLARGEFVALLDPADELASEALFEVVTRLNQDRTLDLIYTDEDKLDLDGRRVEPFFKPGWSPDLLLSMNYVAHLAVFRRRLLEECGGFRAGFEGSHDYDLVLRFTDWTQRIAHVARVLYHWRKVPGSAAASSAAEPAAYESARKALGESLARRGRDGQVEMLTPGTYAIGHRLRGAPLVSIIIPTRDRWPLLQQCLRSIEEKTTYAPYEVIVLDNDSREPDTIRGLLGLAGKIRVYPFPGAFNFSAINNFGVAQARGDYLLFLNNDTQVVEPGWLTAMLEHAQRPDVGAVGARLHYPDGRIQHAGVVLGIGGAADHAFRGVPGEAFSYFGLASVVRNVSAVTAACMAMSRRVFEDIGGFDERFRVALNDVDLCLRLRRRGYEIVYAPRAHLIHHESGTRGRMHPPADEALMWKVWGEAIRAGDPYYNENLTRSRTDWSLDV